MRHESIAVGWRMAAALAALVTASWTVATVATADTAGPAKADAKIRVVVVVGGHGYDVKNFPAMFEAMKDVDFAIRPAQEKGKAHLFDDPNNFAYDVIVLYNMSNKLTDAQGENFLKLLDKGVGLFVCHHAICGFQEWSGWANLIGARYHLKNETYNKEKCVRSIWKDDVDLKMHVEDAEHPITKGLKDFEIVDETYGEWTYLPGNRLLVSTEHAGSNKQIAWVRPQGNRRVFMLQLGHGPHAWKTEGFRHLLSQGIRWAAGKLPAAKDDAGAAKGK